MGVMIGGVWHDTWYDTGKTGGAFMRQDSQFRDWVTADGRSGFPAEPGRYHLYVSLACPWASRTVILRTLKGLQDAVGMTVVSPLMLERGWVFDADDPDPVLGASALADLYRAARPDYSGRVTVPLLWDRVRGTIVSNESSNILRMFNRAFDAVGGDASVDVYPDDLAAEIDALNATIYDTVNNGVYKAGFATRQEPYEAACRALFETLDALEQRLATRRYLCGSRITEADWRLFTTLVRFDAVYYGHFKCNLRQLRDYPNLWGYTRDLYAVPGVAATVSLDHIKRHYYISQRTINPSQVVPLGPELDFSAPSGREALGRAGSAR
jgi:putative glutathione S-transferase